MKAIQVERRARGFNQTELAALCGLSQGDVSRFENGRAIPTAAQAARLSKVLGLPPDALLREVREHEPAPDAAEAATRG